MKNLPELIILGDKQPSHDVLFDLPLNPLHRPIIAIWAGANQKLHQLSLICETIDVFGWGGRLLVDVGWSNLLPDGTSKLEYDARDTSQLVEILEYFESSNIVLIGPDLEMGSQEQILAEKLLTKLSKQILISSETFRIFKTNPKLYAQTELTVIASTAELVGLAARLKVGVRIDRDAGIYNKIDLLRRLSLGQTKRFIIFDEWQIIAYDSRDDTHAAVYNANLQLPNQKAIFIAVTAALLAAGGEKVDFMDRILTSCFLLKQTQIDEKIIKLPKLKSILAAHSSFD